jgi:hypothetical protein
MKVLLLALVVASGAVVSQRAVDERLSFQTHSPWSPRINLDADVAMAYGIGRDLPARIASWRDHGYRVQVMTGVAWGQYQGYLDGQFDGRNHWDEAQKQRDGKLILHGGNPRVPYMSPGESYGRYLTQGVERALDAGAEAIYLEEPEFWARAGYEENFKREWKAYYGEEWQAPDSSPDAQYRSSKLKYFLYRRALSQIFDFVKKYGKAHGRSIPCYVPTHSLINYAHWRIVSPESSLIEVGADGYIAQVWTGTARTPNVYEGRRKERTFETAFLEYGAMQNLVRASGRRVWYLNDPIEDNPNHSWDDYRSNWENTLTASLLQPEVWRYEIMPWPERIFTRNYPAKDGPNAERVPIPKAYETELQAVIRALGEMKQPLESVSWQQSGMQGVGVLVSDTMMFQRADPAPSDANLGSFYGLAMPLVKRGIPVEPVQIESADKPDFLFRYKLLLLTYEGQKPPTAAFHEALASWVRAGGALVVVDDDTDPYNAVREWWTTETPRQRLFETLGLDKDAIGLARVGSGVVLREAKSPAALTYEADGADTVRNDVRRAAEAVKLAWKETNALVLRRGPYLVAAALDESVPQPDAQLLKGHYVDLFDAKLPVLEQVSLTPSKRALLFDLERLRSRKPAVVAAACRVDQEEFDGNVLKFRANGIASTEAVVVIASRRAPAQVIVAGKTLDKSQYDVEAGSVRLRFLNTAAPFFVEVGFR